MRSPSRWSTDPIAHAWEGQYVGMGGNPVGMVDVLGLESGDNDGGYSDPLDPQPSGSSSAGGLNVGSTLTQWTSVPGPNGDFLLAPGTTILGLASPDGRVRCDGGIIVTDVAPGAVTSFGYAGDTYSAAFRNGQFVDFYDLAAYRTGGARIPWRLPELTAGDRIMLHQLYLGTAPWGRGPFGFALTALATFDLGLWRIAYIMWGAVGSTVSDEVVLRDVDGSPVSETEVALIGGSMAASVSALRTRTRVQAARPTVSSRPVLRLTTTIPAEKVNQLARRGWTAGQIEEVVNNPFATRRSIARKSGNPATAYYLKNGHYVVRDDLNGTLVQISDLRLQVGWSPGMWIPDPSIIDPYVP